MVLNQRAGVAKVRPFILPAIVFAIGRVLLLPLPQPTSDVKIYAAYAWEYETAMQVGRSIYEQHALAPEETRVAGRLSWGEETSDVEYPPLALQVLRLPTLWMSQADGDNFEDFAGAYTTAYRRGMAVIDVMLFALVGWLAARLYVGNTRTNGGPQLLFYAASTTALWHLLCDRLDLLQGMGVLLAFALLISRRHYLWSFAVLALTVNFKLVPLVLTPIWVIGSLPLAPSAPLWRGNQFVRLVVRGTLMGWLVIAPLLPFLLTTGTDCLGFLRYHRSRGLELGSLGSSLLLALRPLGHAMEIEYSYGSINVHSSLAALIARLSPWVGAVFLLAATVLLLVRANRVVADARAGENLTLAQRYPTETAAFSLLFLMVFVATSKVFSPQYLLWLLPLAALAPITGGARRIFFGGFLVVCVLSTILVPFLFVFDLLEPGVPAGQPPVFRRPTTRLIVVLLLRNLLFLALTTAIAVHLIRRSLIAPKPECPSA